MVGLLLRLRWLAAVVALVSGIHAVAFVTVGVVRGIQGYRLIFEGPPWEGIRSPGVHLARSIDAFLIAMVFVVFSIGTTTLFVARPDSRALDAVPGWMQVKNLSELKFLIWEAILSLLVVASVEAFIVMGHELTWGALVLPAAVLILATGLFLARKAQ